MASPSVPFAGYTMTGGTWQFGDADGDDRQDLFHIWSGGIHTWFSAGDGTYAVTASFKPDPGDSMTAGLRFMVGDHDGDGRDGLTHIWSGGVNTWFSAGDGTYGVTAPFLPLPGYSTSGGTWRSPARPGPVPGARTAGVRVGLVTGTVGVGKSTVGFAVARRAAERGTGAAFLDLDGMSRLWPAPGGDPYNTELILTNVRSVVGNYRAAGAELLVLAWVITDAAGLAALEAAVGAPVTAVRLLAPEAVVATRLRQRHQGPEADGLAWHLHRAPELATIQDHGLQLPTVDASDSVEVIAAQVLTLFTHPA